MRFSHQAVAEAEVDMTSMLDVVFIMLIFFVVTSSFVKESGLSFLRPTSDIPTTPNTASVVLLTLHSNGDIHVGDRIIDFRTLPAWIESQRRNNVNVSVLLQAHTEASTDDLMKVVNQLKSVGIEKLSVATFE